MLRFLPIIFFSGLSLLWLSGCDRTEESPSALASPTPEGFELVDGFNLTLVASEPLIADPVDMEIDEYGNLYVVEMPGYPLDTSGSGRIKKLTDSNGDGRMDSATVFADGLTLPTGILRWKQGVLVVDTPRVVYLEDTNGDGQADKREVILTGFAVSNPQHNVNNPELGLDNWIYLGHEPAITTNLFPEEFGDGGSEVHYADRPDSPRLPVNADGRSVRFRPDTGELELLASKTQFGHSFTAFGQRLTVNNNNHVMHEVIPARYLQRNPHLPVASATRSLSDHGDAAPVFPITQNPEHQLLTDKGIITAASGITAYLGNVFGEDYKHSVFVAESVSNLVHVDRLRQEGVSFVASRMHQEREFLASTDAWFRPVNFYVGPEGGLYVVDYYRRIVEHPEWMAEDAVTAGNLYDGREQGRIYRVMPADKTVAQADVTMPGEMSVPELIDTLAHPNHWWRKQAQRLLVDRWQDTRPEPNYLDSLEQMAGHAQKPLGRLHALWTLQGIGQLRPEVIQGALSDPEPGVRENAIQLAELHLPGSPRLAQALLALADEAHPRVRFQLLATLGDIDTPAAASLREQMLFAHLDDPWMQIAALSAPPEQNRDLLDAALKRYRPAYDGLVERLAAMEAATAEEEQMASRVRQATQLGESADWQAALLSGLAQGHSPESLSPPTLERVQQQLLESVFEHPSLEVGQAAVTYLRKLPDSASLRHPARLDRARSLAIAAQAKERKRLLAVEYLMLADAEGEVAVFQSLIQEDQPLALQLGAAEALGATDADRAAAFLLEHWPQLAPELQDAALNVLLQSPVAIAQLLTALESGQINPASLGWRRSVRLMTQRDADLRERARALLAEPEGGRAQAVASYRPALSLEGSAGAGAQVYQQQCAVCHTVGATRGMAFGPDLASLGNRQPGNLLADILDPNRSIADGYDLWELNLTNGTRLQGVVASQTPSAVTLRQAGGAEQVISRQQITDMTTLPMSAMPEGLERTIDHQQMADLLAFIRDEDEESTP